MKGKAAMALSTKEIAKLAGVSDATVSRVINNHPSVAPDTKARVESVINQYGYMRNMVARGLRRQQSDIIGVIIPDITNEFFARIVLSVQDALLNHGYLVVMCNIKENDSLEEASLKMLKAQSIAGLIYISGRSSGDMAPQSGVPTIYIDRDPVSAWETNAALITSDNREGGRLAARELIEKGCKRIAILTDKRKVSTYTDRYEGWREVLLAAGLPVDPRLVLKLDEITFDQAQKQVTDLVASGQSFDGLFCANDTVAVGALTALHRLGVSVPKQVKVIGFDDTSIAQQCSKPLTTIRQKTDEMGRMAVDALLDLMVKGMAKSHQHILPVELIRRTTT
jgi:LacI family transcriptional regulator